MLEDFTQLVTMNSWAKPFFEALRELLDSEQARRNVLTFLFYPYSLHSPGVIYSFT